MKRVTTLSFVIGLGAFAVLGLAQDQPPMSFFVTSAGPGDGGNLGGLAGADAHCQAPASAVGRGDATWQAYLSQTPSVTGPRPTGAAQVHARDRIGQGPWYNAKGVVIAWDLEGLHQDRNNIRKPTALDENGNEVPGAGDLPNEHDILTGSDSTGRLVPGNSAYTTCNNWTSNSGGGAIVGHHDRLGGDNASWNSVHTGPGCSQEELASSAVPGNPGGGAGRFYCFAAD